MNILKLTLAVLLLLGSGAVRADQPFASATETATELRELYDAADNNCRVPGSQDVKVVVGHGKMTEQQLSSVMEQMVEGEAQVLVCTTIIETGIDIANVNTLIIEDADKMGLSQLHQLRGRIGRSARRAYAYMTCAMHSPRRP